MSAPFTLFKEIDSPKPELIIGLVGAFGTPLESVIAILKEVLKQYEYIVTELRLSKFLDAYELSTPIGTAATTKYESINILMSRGNELRDAFDRGDALAMHAIAHIAQSRGTKDRPNTGLDGKAIILRQLKHPDEVQLLRQVYGDSFHLIGIYTPEVKREEYLRNVNGFPAADAKQLIERDFGEAIKYGQQVSKTYHLADIFLEVTGWSDHQLDETKKQITRYMSLVFGKGVITPNVDEYGMYFASAAAMRSSDLSRQVGAAILTKDGDVISVGSNEVPKAGGGQYWAGPDDKRDFILGFDSNEKIKRQSVREILAHIVPNWSEMEQICQDEQLERTCELLSQTRIMNLTEFGRAVHAEMEAILSAARRCAPIKDHVLYTTTFPCHNCAKHIVGSGISNVFFIEPYPKSLALQLHGDAINYDGTSGQEFIGSLKINSFVGVSPRRFKLLFSSVNYDGTRIRRKDSKGDILNDTIGLRSYSSSISYLDKEMAVARYLHSLSDQIEMEFQ